MRNSVAILLINAAVLFYLFELSLQSPMEPEASGSRSVRSRASSSASKQSRASVSGSKQPEVSNSGTKNKGAERFQDNGLYVPPGNEIWWRGKYLVAKNANGVYHPYLYHARFCILQRVASKKDKKNIAFKVIVMSGKDWVEKFMKRYSEHNQDPAIYESALKMEEELTEGKRKALEEVRRAAAFEALAEFDKSHLQRPYDGSSDEYELDEEDSEVGYSPRFNQVQPSAHPGYPHSFNPAQPGAHPGYAHGFNPAQQVYHPGYPPNFNQAQPGAYPGHPHGFNPTQHAPRPAYHQGYQPQQGALPPYQQGAIPPYQQGAIPPYQQGALPPYQQGALPPYQQGALPPYQQGAHPLYPQGYNQSQQGARPQYSNDSNQSQQSGQHGHSQGYY